MTLSTRRSFEVIRIYIYDLIVWLCRMLPLKWLCCNSFQVVFHASLFPPPSTVTISSKLRLEVQLISPVPSTSTRRSTTSSHLLERSSELDSGNLDQESFTRSSWRTTHFLDVF